MEQYKWYYLIQAAMNKSRFKSFCEFPEDTPTFGNGQNIAGNGSSAAPASKHTKTIESDDGTESKISPLRTSNHDLGPASSKSCRKPVMESMSLSHRTLEEEVSIRSCDHSKKNQSEKAKLMNGDWIPTCHIKWQPYEKVTWEADDERADMICTEPHHGPPSLFRKGSPEKSFEDAEMLDFVRFYNQSIVNGGYILILTPIDNSKGWKQALTRQRFTVIGYSFVNARCLSVDSDRDLTNFP